MDRRWDKSKPPRGPWVLNPDCPQAVGLKAWYPWDGILGHTFLSDMVGSVPLTGVNSPTLAIGLPGLRAGNFVQASAQHYSNLSAVPVTGVPLSLYAWCFPDTSTQTVMQLAGATLNDFFRIVLVSAKVRANCGTETGGAQANAITTVSYNASDWNLVSATFTSTSSRTARVNEGNAVSESTAITPLTANSRTLLGIAVTTGEAYTLQPFSGRIGDAGIYNIALTDQAHFRLWDPSTRYELRYPLRSRKWMSIGAAPGTGQPWHYYQQQMAA